MSRAIVKSTLGRLALSAIVNLRYPAVEPDFWYLQPSLDVTLIFFTLATLGLIGVRTPRVALLVLASGLVFLRVFRLADGVALRMQQRTINLFIDAQLLPDLLRLASATVPTFKLLGLTLGGTILLSVIGWYSYTTLRSSARLLSKDR